MVAIIDYNAGNLKSVEKAVTLLQEPCRITRDRNEILHADKVILPGVGAFGDAMSELKKYELDKVIREVAEKGTPFLGICMMRYQTCRTRSGKTIAIFINWDQQSSPERRSRLERFSETDGYGQCWTLS